MTYSIPVLAARRFGEGDILVREQLSSAVDPFRRYVVEYPSDGVTVTALMNVPYGDGPFPVIVLLHGYADPTEYERGFDTRPLADYLTMRGYAAIMPDYRGYAGTPGSPNPMRIPYAIDVLNLIESLDTLDYLDAERVGVFGHSMGGGVATYPMVLSPRVDATVLYGAMSADQATNWRYIHEKWAGFWMDFTAREFGGSPDDNPQDYALASPINYLERVTAPVQIHHGTDDQEVPVEWSADLAERLRAAGVEVTYYEYEGAGHTFRYAEQDLLFERTLAFFDKHVR
jgi:dipeptidyl aminopeptidase/acylaminoacyl peptidase